MNAVFKHLNNRGILGRAIVDGAASATYVIVPPVLSEIMPPRKSLPTNIRGDMALRRHIEKSLKGLETIE